MFRAFRYFHTLLQTALYLSPIPAPAPHPTELRVARTRRSQILLTHLGDLVGLNRFALGFDIDLVKLRRVQVEDLRFDFGSEFLVAVFFGHFIADLETTEALDLRLWAAAPDRIGAPDDVVFAAGQIQDLTQEVHRGNVFAAEPARQTVPRAAQFEIDIPQVVLLHDLDQLGTPRDVLWIGRGAFTTRACRGRVPGGVIDDEVEIGKTLGGFLDVLRMALLLVEQSQWEALVNADVLDAQFA